jgi:hypothetical protein
MDSVALQNQFYSFYGASVAPYDLTILASMPELLILIDFITQFEGAQISRAANIESLLKSVPATPDGYAEAISSFVVPLSEKYKQEFQKTPALAHLSEQFFTILQLNIIIRLACCICITIIKQGRINEDLLRKLNEFSGQIGLFHNSQRGPLEIPAAIITEVESSVSVIEGPASANNSKALTRRNKGGVRRKLRKTRRRQQKGGGRWWTTLLSMFGIAVVGKSLPSSTPAAPAAGAVQLNRNRGLFIAGNIPREPAAAVAAVAVGAGGATAGAGASARNNAAPFIANAGPGFVGWDATAEVLGAVDFTFETLLDNTKNISAPLPYGKGNWKTEYKTTLAAENFASLSFPEVSSAAFTVTTPTGNHTVLKIFELPPVPDLAVDVVSLNILGICGMKLAGLQYLSNTLTEISAILTIHTTQPITSGGLRNFYEIGIANDSIEIGSRSRVGISSVKGSNRVGFYHTHPVIFDRLHSFGSSMDWDGFIRGYRETLNIISTQTGLLVYTFHPEILLGLDSPSFKTMWGSYTAFMESISAAGFSASDIPLVQDSNNKLVNTWTHGLAPGRYKVIPPCSNTTSRSIEGPPNEGCLPRQFDVVLGDKTVSIPYLFDIVLIPYQLVLQGLANIPIYSTPAIPTRPSRKEPGPLPSSRGFTMSANATSESLVLRYQASNNIVVPNIPRLFSVDISCFRPESVLKGFESYEYQQRCLYQAYITNKLSLRKDMSFHNIAQGGPRKLGEVDVAGAVDLRTQSSAAITAIIAPGLAAIQQAFTTP